MKPDSVVDVRLHSFVTSPLDAPEWSASRTVALSQEMESGTHSTEGRAGLRVAQGLVEKRKTFVHTKSRIPNRPAHSPVTVTITLYRLVVTFHNYVSTFV